MKIIINNKTKILKKLKIMTNKMNKNKIKIKNNNFKLKLNNRIKIYNYLSINHWMNHVHHQKRIKKK